MRTTLVVALLSLSLPGLVHAESPDLASPDTGASSEPFASDDSEAYPGEELENDVIFSGTPEYGVYLAPTSQIADFQDRTTAFVGGRGGLIVSDVLRVGGGANWMLGRPHVAMEGTPRLRMRYGGGLIGLNIGADSVVHPSIDVLIGGGKAEYDSSEMALDGRSSSFFVVDAATGLDFNVTYGIRLHVGGGYRYVSSLQMPGLRADEVSGPFGMAQLKFGAF